MKKCCTLKVSHVFIFSPTETSRAHSGSGSSFHAVLSVPADYSEQQKISLRYTVEIIKQTLHIIN